MSLNWRLFLMAIVSLSTVATSTSSDIIVLDASLTASFSFWIGGSITLNQCNEECAEVNTGLFSTCGAYQSIFQNHMRCCCSTTFAQKVKICSACCNQLGYTSYYSQLTQVDSACDQLDKKGNTTDVAKTMSYTPVTYTATLPAQTATQTVVVVTTAEPTTISPQTATKTVVVVTTAHRDEDDELTTTTTVMSMTSSKHKVNYTTSSSMTSSSSCDADTNTSVSATTKITTTTTIPASATSSTIPTTTTTTKVALPTVTSMSGASNVQLWSAINMSRWPLTLSIFTALALFL